MPSNIPTEPGFYWWRLKDHHRWVVVEVEWLEPARLTLIYDDPWGTMVPVSRTPGFFGPRIPSPEELADRETPPSRSTFDENGIEIDPFEPEIQAEIMRRINAAKEAGDG